MIPDVDSMAQARKSHGRASTGSPRAEIEQDMADKSRPAFEPDWLNPANDRKAPYSDAELDTLAADFIAMNSDTAAWRELVTAVGEQQARQVVRQRLAAQDANSLINWLPEGSLH